MTSKVACCHGYILFCHCLKTSQCQKEKNKKAGGSGLTEFHLLVPLLNQTQCQHYCSCTELLTPLSPVGLFQGRCLTNLGHMNNFPSRFCKMSSQVPSLHSLTLKQWYFFLLPLSRQIQHQGMQLWSANHSFYHFVLLFTLLLAWIFLGLSLLIYLRENGLHYWLNYKFQWLVIELYDNTCRKPLTTIEIKGKISTLFITNGLDVE